MSWGSWVAQSIEHRTLDFGPGHDLRGVTRSPASGFALSKESAWESLSPSSFAPTPPSLVCTCTLSLSQNHINKSFFKKEVFISYIICFLSSMFFSFPRGIITKHWMFLEDGIWKFLLLFCKVVKAHDWGNSDVPGNPCLPRGLPITGTEIAWSPEHSAFSVPYLDVNHNPQDFCLLKMVPRTGNSASILFLKWGSLPSNRKRLGK